MAKKAAVKKAPAKKAAPKKAAPKKAVAKKAPVKRVVKQSPDVPSFRPGEIRGWRVSRGLTQAALASKLGVSFMTVNRWENGKFAPSAPFATKLAKLMGK